MTFTSEAKMPHHTLLVLLQDRPGALHRTVTLFRRRSYNIASLEVVRSEMEGLSRMTVVIEAPSPDQVMKELERLIEVFSVRDVTRHPEPSAATLVSARVQADGACDEVEAA